jgi:hypothetical protein
VQPEEVYVGVLGGKLPLGRGVAPASHLALDIDPLVELPVTPPRDQQALVHFTR